MNNFFTKKSLEELKLEEERWWASFERRCRRYKEAMKKDKKTDDQISNRIYGMTPCGD